MRIQHNISALNASNKLKSNDNAISKNIAKLSSGYRINSAADDAAGLAVSEKMRSQINGLTQAESNAENGISLVQTAEGGLNETESILQRMNTLAVESSNGTYQDATDRANLNKEITALKSEVDRISTSTNFNQINLLDGTLGSTTSTLKATVELSSAAKANQAFTYTDATKGTFTTSALTAPTGVVDGQKYSYTVNYVDANGAAKSITADLNFAEDGTKGLIKDASGKVLVTLATSNVALATEISKAVVADLSENKDFTSLFTIGEPSTVDGSLIFTSNAKGTDGGSISGVSTNDATATPATLQITATYGANAYEGTDTTKLKIFDGTNATDSVFTVNGQAFAFVTKGGATGLASDVNTITLSTTAGITDADVSKMAALINSKTGLSTQSKTTTLEYVSKSQTSSTGALTMQIGSDNKNDQRVSLSIADMSAKGLGIQNVTIGTQADALKAIDTIKTAINTVSATRADLGALQNRLEHTSNNLSTMNENLTSAESNIRDVDMSDEYVQYSKNQILSQAATSMLAQANSQPQNVLTLLKG